MVTMQSMSPSELVGGSIAIAVALAAVVSSGLTFTLLVGRFQDLLGLPSIGSATRWVLFAAVDPSDERAVRRMMREMKRVVRDMPVHLPSGARSVPMDVAFIINPEDLVRLEAVVDIATVEADLRVTILNIATEQHWDVPAGGPRVTICERPSQLEGSVRVECGRATRGTDEEAFVTTATSTQTTSAATTLDVPEGEEPTREFCVAKLTAGSVTRTLAPHGEYSIGRSRRSTVVLTDPRVSSHHALVRHASDGWVIVARPSKNGTRLDGVALKSDVPTPLRRSHLVQLGPNETLRFTSNCAC